MKQKKRNCPWTKGRKKRGLKSKSVKKISNKDTEELAASEPILFESVRTSLLYNSAASFPPFEIHCKNITKAYPFSRISASIASLG